MMKTMETEEENIVKGKLKDEKKGVNALLDFQKFISEKYEEENEREEKRKLELKKKKERKELHDKTISFLENEPEMLEKLIDLAVYNYKHVCYLDKEEMLHQEELRKFFKKFVKDAHILDEMK